MSVVVPGPRPGPGGPDTLLSVGRGLLGRCPACGEGRLFGRFLKVAPACASCGAEFHHHRADDFPPYLVMFAVGHLVGYGIYVSETRFDDVPLWLHAAVWPTLAIGLCLALLQPVKGAVVGLQYGLGMHGFGVAARERAASGRITGERRDAGAAANAVGGPLPGARMAEPGSP